MQENNFDTLKEKLDKQEWPAIYLFKFIVPIEKIDEVTALFEKQDTKTKISRNGNYISLTAKPFMYSSEKVIEIYKKATRIEGLIAL